MALDDKCILEVVARKTCWAARHREVKDFSLRNNFSLTEGKGEDEMIRMQIKKSRGLGKKSKSSCHPPLLTLGPCVDSLLGGLSLGPHSHLETGRLHWEAAITRPGKVVFMWHSL